MAKKNKAKKDHKKDRRPRQDVAADPKNDLAEDYDDSERFDSSKPQFRRPKEETAKVVLDERFSSVLTDSRFQLDVQDKYGRKKKKKEAKDELSAFYTIDEGDDDDNNKEATGTQKDEDTEKKEHHSSSDDESESDDESSQSSAGEKEEATDPRSRIAYLTALSRGEVEADSSSDEDDGDDQSQSSASDDGGESNGEEDPVHGLAGVLDPSTRVEEIDLTEEESPYLAVLNMDWSHVRAVDIFAMISSFTPAGSVKKVQIYPSDFGMEQLAKEEQLGPTGLWKKQEPEPTEEEDSDDDSSSSKGSVRDDGDGGDGNKARAEDSASNGEDDDEDNDARPNVGGTHHHNDNVESDFDPEKLRAYEASKLKYYFAIVELASPHHADVAYREVDGLEFERSGSAMDLRSIPPASLADVVKNRQLHDEASGLPSNYVPPSFVVSALQQTNVQCTWETGDQDREKTLTKYTSGEAWEALAEGEDLKAYLASDGSSDEEDEDDDKQENEKGSKMRKMLGLDSDDEDDPSGLNDKGESTEEESSSDEEAGGDEDEGDVDKEVKFLPGKVALEDKIRSKLESKDEPKEKQLTPWEKYQEKRKEKRRDKRHDARAKRKEVNEIRKGGKEANKPARKEARDSFFLDNDANSSDDNEEPKRDLHSARDQKSKQQLELLAAGDDGDEEARDYDMRGLQRIEKNKDKKLRGSRKRKEAAVVASVSGADFKVNVEDKRFAAVLEGSDDRFGIDRTDPNFKETTAMRDILAEQSRQRKAKRRKTSKSEKGVPDISAERLGADAAAPTPGSSALSSLVQSLKAKVAKTFQ